MQKNWIAVPKALLSVSRSMPKTTPRGESELEVFTTRAGHFVRAKSALRPDHRCPAAAAIIRSSRLLHRRIAKHRGTAQAGDRHRREDGIRPPASKAIHPSIRMEAAVYVANFNFNGLRQPARSSGCPAARISATSISSTNTASAMWGGLSARTGSENLRHHRHPLMRATAA